jgi:hypothetical protein
LRLTRQMDNIWYYAEAGKSVGPLSLADLMAILSRGSDDRGIMVWRNGFSGWVRAEEVPELAALIIKPPPLPQELEPTIPVIGMAARWGSGILHAGAGILVMLLGFYLLGLKPDYRMVRGVFIGFVVGWANGIGRESRKQPKWGKDLRISVVTLCACAVAWATIWLVGAR